MPIALDFPKCHKPFRVRDESIGGRVRCPSCGSVLQVPSALSPASNFGDEPKAEGGGPRPVAEEVPPGGSRTGALPAGGADHVDLNPAAGGPLPGPPSIRAQALPVPSRAPVTLPPAPQRVEAPQRSPVRLPADGDPAWSRVHGGLGMVRWALLLCGLVFLAAFGHGVWCVVDPDGALKTGAGFLGKEDWPRWKEVLVAYTVGPLVPAALLLLLGRLRCAGAPAEAHARTLALGAAFFTVVGLAAIALYFGMRYFDLGDKLHLPPVARTVAGIAAPPAAVLADVLTLLFIGQIGWPLGRPGLQKSVAGVFGYVLIVPAGILIGHLFYPVYGAAVESWRQSGSPLGSGDDSDLARRVMIWTVILLAAGLLFFLRYASVAGAARRAIRRRLAGEA